MQGASDCSREAPEEPSKKKRVVKRCSESSATAQTARKKAGPESAANYTGRKHDLEVVDDMVRRKRCKLQAAKKNRYLCTTSIHSDVLGNLRNRCRSQPLDSSQGFWVTSGEGGMLLRLRAKRLKLQVWGLRKTLFSSS